MNTTLTTTDNTVTLTGRTQTVRPRPATKRPAPAPTVAPSGDELIGKRPASELTRLVFCAILGISACIALVGVMDQASSTSPDAPAPAVIIDVD